MARVFLAEVTSEPAANAMDRSIACKQAQAATAGNTQRWKGQKRAPKKETESQKERCVCRLEYEGDKDHGAGLESKIW